MSTTQYNLVTADRLRSVLNYDPATGEFRWLTSRGTQQRGAIAGFHWTGGYRKIRVYGRNYFSHRLAFLFMTGKWPNKETDHINRIRCDNRWVNLREATRAENMQNKSAYANKVTSRHAGVSWNKAALKWKAQIQVNGKKRGLGYFNSEYEAHAAYLNAKRIVHPRYYQGAQ